MDITYSMIRSFKSCRRKFFFQYVENIKPEVTPEALATGSNYHALIEKVFKGEDFELDSIPAVMADAFRRLLPWKDFDIVEAEKEFCIDLPNGHRLLGKLDGEQSNGDIVEHKTSGFAINESYMEKVQRDDQITTYLLAQRMRLEKPINRAMYTVCQKPTIRLKKGQTMPEYLDECIRWYDDTKVQCFTVVRSNAEIEDYYNELIYLADEMEACRKYYKNPSNCMIMGCEYSSICLDYDPQCMVGFIKKERGNEELCSYPV